MTDLADQIAVMEAYKAGSAVERSNKDGKAWRMDPDPVWNWQKFDYRVSTEREYHCIEGDYKLYAIFDDKKAARVVLEERYLPRDETARVTELVVKPRNPQPAGR